MKILLFIYMLLTAIFGSYLSGSVNTEIEEPTTTYSTTDIEEPTTTYSATDIDEPTTTYSVTDIEDPTTTCSSIEIDEPMDLKPVIYLYPTETMQVKVELDYNGSLTVTYPKYENGWTVTAHPDGTLEDENGRVYNYLYWEGSSDIVYDMSEGFCVKGSETAAFLENVLADLGLTRREANEFIVFWLPMMEGNEYNVIAFQNEEYTENARLTINPQPDTILRVFMTWYGSDEFVELPKQQIVTAERNGYTVVEWGGREINN